MPALCHLSTALGPAGHSWLGLKVNDSNKPEPKMHVPVSSSWVGVLFDIQSGQVWLSGHGLVNGSHSRTARKVQVQAGGTIVDGVVWGKSVSWALGQSPGLP